MMIDHSRCLRRLFCLAIFAMGSLTAGYVPVPEPAPETLAAYQAWAKRVDIARHRGQEHPEGFDAILQLPDADLVFLNLALNGDGYERAWARRGLIILESARATQQILAAATHDDRWYRERAVSVMRDVPQPAFRTALIQILQQDPISQNRQAAASALGQDDSAESIAALTAAMAAEDRLLALAAARSLAWLQVADAIDPAYALLQTVEDEQTLLLYLDALVIHRHPRAIPHMLELMEQAPTRFPNQARAEMITRAIRLHLEPYALLTENELGPIPDTPEQWRVWWADAEPLFDEQMKRRPTPEPPTYAAADFGDDPTALALQISTDAATYRPGEAIRLDLRFSNPTDSPYQVIPPRPPSPWWRPMAWGMQLQRLDIDAPPLVDFPPSDTYQGSYSGPPRFETLAPGATVTHQTCLQIWHPSNKGLWPLEPGDYQLTLTYDTAEFAGVQPEAPELTGRWQVAPIRFTVAGEKRRAPAEIMALVKQKSGLRWLESDLVSQIRARNAQAWDAICLYGDSRLRPLMPDDATAKTFDDYVEWGRIRQV